MTMICHSKKITQKDIVLRHLKENKKISSWNAITKYRITRLSDVIHRLKKEGYHITTTMKTHKSSTTGKTSNYALYTLLDNVDIGGNYELSLN